jgi:hypothetical protein
VTTLSSVPTPPPRDGWADALAEAAEVRDASFQRRYEILEAACRAVFEILERHPEREAILAYQEPLPEASRTALEQARRVDAG